MSVEPDRLIFTTSRLKTGVTGAVLFAAMWLGLWFISVTDDAVTVAWSWVGVTALGLGVAGALWGLKSPPCMKLTPEGFRIDGPFGVGPIPWRDVDAFFVYSEQPDAEGHGGVPPHAAWRLVEGAAARGALVSRINQAGLGIDGVVPRHLGPPPEEMADLLERWRARYS